MTSSRALLATVLLAIVTQTQALQAEPLSLPAGSYEITARLELPHLERWGVDKTTIICLPGPPSSGNIPVPVVSTNNPFAKCSAANLSAEGSNLEYDIVCHERGSAERPCRLPAFSKRIQWSYRDGDGCEKHDDDGSAARPPDRECSPAKLGSAADRSDL